MGIRVRGFHLAILSLPRKSLICFEYSNHTVQDDWAADFWRLGLSVSPLPIWLLLTPSMRCIEMDGHGSSQIFWVFWILLHFQTSSNRQPDGSLHILVDLFQGQLCLFSRKSHGLVLALLFSRENSLYQFCIRLKIKTSTLSGFLDASGRLFYCLVFVQLK